MKSIELVSLNRHMNGLFIANADVNSVALSIYLKKNGVEIKNYHNENLTSTEDIVDDILSEYMDIVCFTVTENNRDFVYGVSKYLVENEEDTELLFVLMSKDIEEIPFGKNINPSNVLIGLSAVVEFDKCVEIDASMLEKVYCNKVLPVGMSENLGIILNVWCSLFNIKFQNSFVAVKEELDYVTSYLSFRNRITLLSDNIKEYRDLDALNSFLNNTGYRQSITVRDLFEEGRVTDKKYPAIRNGIRAFYTGLYYDTQEMTYTKHISFDTLEIRDGFFESMSEHSAANSGFYVRGKKTSKQYDAIKDAAVEAGYLLSNIVTFDDLDDGESYEVRINNTNASMYRIISYADAKNMKNDSCIFTRLDTSEALEMFVLDVKIFNEEGLVPFERMWKYDLVDNCRWINYRSCSLNRLYRMNIKDGKVYPCLSSQDSIGDIGEMHFALLKNANVKTEEAQIARNCSDCSAKQVCPKCSMLPEYLSKESYCKIMQGNFYFEQYFFKMMAIRLFFHFLKIKKLQGVTPDMMEFTTAMHSSLFKSINYGKSRLREYVILGRVKNSETYIIFNWQARAAILVNKILYMVAELLNAGFSNNEIYSKLAETFNTSIDIAKVNIDECLNFLSERGYVKDE